MKHHFIDHYSSIDSPVHSLDPRVKIILALLILISIVVTPNGRFIDFVFYAPLLVLLLLLSHIPLVSILKRMLVILPLVILIGFGLPFMSPGKTLISFTLIKPITITDVGIFNFFSVVIKATLAIWVMTLLTSTTRFRDLVSGMQKLKFPVIFTSLLGFMYRYIFLIIDELEKENIGRRARSFGAAPCLAMKGFGWMISSVFIRSFDRAERIYQSMCTRGFDGNFETLTLMKLQTKDIVVSFIILSFIIIIKIVGHYYA